MIDDADRGDPVEVTGDDLDGTEMALSDTRGTVTVINVWGSWCPPCLAEMPDLVAVAKQTRGEAEFVGINTRDTDQAQALAFEDKYDVPYPSFFDPDGRALLSLDAGLSARSIPATIVLDPEGRVAARILGPVPTQQTLVDIIEEAGS